MMSGRASFTCSLKSGISWRMSIAQRLDRTDRSEPLTKICALLRPALPIDCNSLSKAPNGAGAYALALHLRKPVFFERARLTQNLRSGWYVYAGSAYGPGGIRARLCRHFKKTKKLHWHVDQLTGAAEDICAVAVPDGSECEIIATLARSRAFQFVAEGFGSSDCRICQSHLLAWRRN